MLETIELKLPLDQEELAQLWLREVGGLLFGMFDSMASAGTDARELPGRIWRHHRLMDQARGLSSNGSPSPGARHSTIWRTIQERVNEYDGLLTPTLGGLPVPNAGDSQEAFGFCCVSGRPVERCIGWWFTRFFNFYRSPQRLPCRQANGEFLQVRLQIVGRRLPMSR